MKLPARLPHPGQLALQGKLPEADATKPKLTDIGAWPTT